MLNDNNFAGYQIKELCDWNNFKKIDVVIQNSFIKSLANEFDANTTDIANMFGLDRSVIDFYFKKHNIKPHLGRSQDEIKRKRWAEFLRKLKVKRQENKLELINTQLIHGDLTFKGDANEILSNILTLCKGKNITVNVKW